MKQIYIIIFIAVCIIGCKEKKEKQETDSSIQYLEVAKFIKNDTVSDFDLIDKFKYIKLETSDNCLVGDIAHLKFFDNRIIIADKNQRVLAFDTLGNFIRQVGALGNAGQEYIALMGIFINEEKREIILLGMKKVLYYDLDGKFIRSQYIDYDFVSDVVDIDIFKGSILKQTTCCFENIYNSTIYSEADLSKPSHLHQYPINRMIGLYPQSYNSISKTKEGLTFVKLFSDTIFQFNGTDIYPKYIWVEDKMPIPQKKFVSYNTQNDKEVCIIDFFATFEDKYSEGVNSIYETKDHLVVFPMRSGPYLWNKHEKKGLSQAINSFGVKRRPNICLFSTIKDVDNNYLVCAYDYGARKQVLKREELMEALSEPMLRKLIKECKDEDNPIIALYTLKKEFPWESYKKEK